MTLRRISYFMALLVIMSPAIKATGLGELARSPKVEKVACVAAGLAAFNVLAVYGLHTAANSQLNDRDEGRRLQARSKMGYAADYTRSAGSWLSYVAPVLMYVSTAKSSPMTTAEKGACVVGGLLCGSTLISEQLYNNELRENGQAVSDMNDIKAEKSKKSVERIDRWCRYSAVSLAGLTSYFIYKAVTKSRS